MRELEVAITPERRLLEEVDALVAAQECPNRSQAGLPATTHFTDPCQLSEVTRSQPDARAKLQPDTPNAPRSATSMVRLSASAPREAERSLDELERAERREARPSARYSALSASVGSTLSARRVGTTHASRHTPSMNAA
jgi:hypothetical protein